MNYKDKENGLSNAPLSTKGLNYHHKWLRNREIGNKPAVGTTNKVFREMYSTIRPVSRWESFMSSKVAVPGAIFNLEFSPDGSMMVAACEKRSILLFDPISQSYVHSVDNAHGDCVNCVRFLDSRMFATCSDDSTVALWDTRNLKTKIRVLNGHSNWVKNVEYSKDDKLLVTSGFDGSIFTWDINSYTERGLLYRRVFATNGLMRMKLSPDSSKMVICTTGGYIMVIHDLDLETLPSDLHEFKPNMYRLMQISETTIPTSARCTHLFNHRRKQNRVEFITDFPRGDEAEVISSLQIHPQGWCALSRNITTDEQSEWTCVHDIQDCSSTTDSFDTNNDAEIRAEENSILSITTSFDQANRLRSHHSIGNSSDSYSDFSTEDNYSSAPSQDVWEALLAIHESRDRPGMFLGIPHANNSSLMPENLRIVRMTSGIEDQYLYEEEVNSSEANTSADWTDSQSTLQNPSYDDVFNNGGGTSHGDSEHSNSESIDSFSGDSYGASLRGAMARESQTIIIVGPRNANNPLQRGQMKTMHRNQIPANHKIHQNKPRLTHYIEETNSGKGFIKELGFSQDGRVICSPFSYGVRLLAFNDTCSELNTCVPTKTPVSLYEIGTCTAHNDIVLCTKFSPRHCMLVSGCHSGNIIWYQPVL